MSTLTEPSKQALEVAYELDDTFELGISQTGFTKIAFIIDKHFPRMTEREANELLNTFVELIITNNFVKGFANETATIKQKVINAMMGKKENKQ